MLVIKVKITATSETNIHWDPFKPESVPRRAAGVLVRSIPIQVKR
jgi:hypothetical protein